MVSARETSPGRSNSFDLSGRRKTSVSKQDAKVNLNPDPSVNISAIQGTATPNLAPVNVGPDRDASPITDNTDPKAYTNQFGDPKVTVSDTAIKPNYLLYGSIAAALVVLYLIFK